MTEMKTTGISRVTISAKIIRANGTVEDCGMVASTRLSDRIKIKAKALLRRFE